MKKWLKRLNISTGLQLCFVLSALLSLFVGMVGLYTWEQQRTNIALAIDRDFPKVQAAFQAEEQINLLYSAFINLSTVKNVSERIEWKTRTEVRLLALRETINELDDNIDLTLFELLAKLEQLLDKLSEKVAYRLEHHELFNQTLAKINWLHDDFHNEFTALLQEITWQQRSLMNTIEHHSQDAESFEQLKKNQQELQLVYSLVTYEDQIVNELKGQITGIPNYSDSMQHNYLIYIQLLVEEKIKKLETHASTYTIKQIMDELMTIGLDASQLPNLLHQRRQIEQELAALASQKRFLLGELRDRLREQVGNSQKQLAVIQNIINKSTHISGLIIIITMLIAFILVIAVNVFYIRLRLLKRFQLLNNAVDRLNNGEMETKIPVFGSDELGRIARLLRTFIFEMKHKNAELAQHNLVLINEINDKIKVQHELESTQHELIQTAKLAIVGQTLTSISHEINQPLNALNTYLFSARKALLNGNHPALLSYFDKMSHLIERTALIIKRLRGFSRKGSGTLQAVNLKQMINDAWNLLESKHKPLAGTIDYPSELPFVLGEDVLLQQVFVNLFLNAIEAVEDPAPKIEISIAHYDEQTITLFMTDNGKGWPLEAKLLEPFSSSKSINLGLGLSISHSIIKQCDGELLLASTLDRHALIILTLRTTTDV